MLLCGVGIRIGLSVHLLPSTIPPSIILLTTPLIPGPAGRLGIFFHRSTVNGEDGWVCVRLTTVDDAQIGSDGDICGGGGSVGTRRSSCLTLGVTRRAAARRLLTWQPPPVLVHLTAELAAPSRCRHVHLSTLRPSGPHSKFTSELCCLRPGQNAWIRLQRRL